MPLLTATASRTMDVPAAAVYAVLADYHEGHPRILPPKYFSGLVVERGGVGAGTEIRFRMHVFGGTHTLRARIEEPEPGRVLREVYPATAMVTTFEVEPLDGGRGAEVRIVTEWEMKGVRAALERWLLVPLLQKIFAEELELIERFMREQQVASGA